MARPPFRITLVQVLGTAVLLTLAYMAFGFERYCHFNPSIDTHYAAGFSESAFAKVTLGMTEAEVTALLGAPLDASKYRPGDARWNYTRDGKCTWTDWAWLGREVFFRDGRVVKKEAHVYYD